MRLKLFNFEPSKDESKDKSSQYYFNKLSQEEQDILNKLKDKVLISASELRAVSVVNEVLRFKYMVGKPLNEIVLEDLEYYLREIKQSSFSDHFKNKIKGFVQRFLKWNYKDWSERFEDFEDINFNSDADRINPITDKDILTQKQIAKILETEKNLYWKTFFTVQYEGAFRTGEVRKLMWSDVTFKDQGFTDVKVSSKKNRNANEKFRELPLKKSTKFLTALKKQQKAEGIKTDWVFPSPLNSSKHISKAVNSWFKKLTDKALGEPTFNYILRHTRGTELSVLVHKGVIPKSLALKFMGHSERMFDKVYSHVKDSFLKKEMQDKIYNFEYMPEEKKHKLELEIEELKKAIKQFVIDSDQRYLDFLDQIPVHLSKINFQKEIEIKQK